jgi:histidinol-phosphate aminotransferase
MSVLYKKALERIKSYKPARSLESAKREFGLTEIIKLAGNENNHGFSPRVTQALLDAQSQVTRYPDSECTVLRETLAARLGVRGDELLFGNGSFELLTLAAQTFLEEGSQAIMPAPSFGWYYIATTAECAEAVAVPLKNHAVDLDAMARAITAKTRLIWLCNPNNPTGGYFGAAALDDFLKTVPAHIPVVLDEAYIDFAASDSPRAVELIHKHQNVIALRTFSKVYGLASLRIGYALGPAEIIEKISRIRQPINTNAFAQAAACAALSDEDHYRYVLNENEKGKQLYYATLKRLGLEYIPTQCNFIMFDTGCDSDTIEGEYIKRGILIRGGKEFGMPTWVRITIGTETENKKVLSILEELIKSGEK